MGKNILVVLGHPNVNSLCAGLAKAYVEGAMAAGHTPRELRLAEMSFDPNLRFGNKITQPLEPDLLAAQEAIQWAQHLVFVYPNWWGLMPALMKGFLDRTLQSGFAFKFHKGGLSWDKLLKGRTAQLLVSMDTPPFIYRWIYGQPGHNAMKRTILGFCGVQVLRTDEFGPVHGANETKLNAFLDRAKRLGREA